MQDIDSVPMKTLDDLAALAQTRETLDDARAMLIVRSRKAGARWKQIADAANLSVAGVQKIARATNGGELPKPDAWEE